ncbi:MAG: hypothetical protein KatS3mg109_1355 [Pirellulaceae bacterium]|nr:MAG: hypothetical protein KatS3mg109_1217 [Pirellulaceae bacterium]GIW90923.1 MAG: hypothetical protein KatS3mg109_1355 [Pirellulaceae bacterium]
MPKNSELYNALVALLELAAATKPQQGPEGTRKPVIDPLPAHVGFRLALCRNALRPTGEAIDEQRERLRAECFEGGNSDPTRFESELRRILDEETDWTPPAKIKLSQLGDRQIPDAWLSAWAAVGILVDE